MNKFLKILFSLFFACKLYGNDALELEEISIFRDLEIVKNVDKQINDHLPLVLNHLLQGGYFAMPSARMPETGLTCVGYSYLPPYRVISGAFQYFSHVELSANYWIYHNIPEYNFGHLGFGDDADRAANIKVALLKKTDGIPFLPEIAFGINDFIGTKRFHSYYFVTTQEFLDYNLELTVGWASGRIKGFFGGIAWFPLRHSNWFFRNLAIMAEYDATNYRNHKYEHYAGRSQKVPINIGAHISLFYDVINISVSSLRGEEVAVSGGLYYNFGQTKGLFPKFGNPLPYTSPIINEPLGKRRTEQELARELAFAFHDQGFALSLAMLTTNPLKQKVLRLRVINIQYPQEEQVRKRIQHVIAGILPSDVHSVEVVVESEGVLLQEYCYTQEELKKYSKGEIGTYEISIISPMKEVKSDPGKYDSSIIYKRTKKVWSIILRPNFQTYFGSSQGKLKYDVGVIFGAQGYLFNNTYYFLLMDYIAKANSKVIKDSDFYNPSQLLNVQSDYVRYVQTNSFHVDAAFLQQNWNIGKGWFAKVSLGYFEVNYAGLGLEALYYPVNSCWAIGFEFAPLIKRKYTGLGFTDEVRKFHGSEAEYVKFFGLQYFVDFYYQFKPLDLDFRISIGQFLARDKGAKFEMAKWFKSRLKVGVWYTVTNAKDRVNGDIYFDKGFFFSIPLDIFLSKSSKSDFFYSMSAWLRDAGVRVGTGKDLYPIIFDDRQENW